MIEPTESDIGRAVIYHEPGDFPSRKVEQGTITSMNDQYVFVRYGMGGTSTATRREYLEWVNP